MTVSNGETEQDANYISASKTMAVPTQPSHSHRHVTRRILISDRTYGLGVTGIDGVNKSNSAPIASSRTISIRFADHL
jgi:hypothetical protein